MPAVHPTAVVDPRAELGEGVTVGPFSVVGAGVRVGARTVLHAHVVVEGPTEIGEDCEIFPFAVVGIAPQHRADDGAGARLVLGRRNRVREHVTLHRGTGGGTTRLGDDNLLMVGCHVAHDVELGSRVVVANGVQLAGHVVVEDDVVFGGLAGVAQHVRVGEGAFVAAGAMCERDVPPFVVVQGDRARVRALNAVGLARAGATPEELRELRGLFRAVHVGRRAVDAVAAPVTRRGRKLAAALARRA